jgi:hypothetical protein
VFERFTDRARRVVVLAQEEARLLNHNYIGTEHVLLGLIHEGDGVAAKALTSMDISLQAVRDQVEQIIGHGGDPPSGHIPFTPRAKKVLELSLREAKQLGHNYIGTEHILLGLIREGEGVAAQVLANLGADLSRVRRRVTELLSGHHVEFVEHDREGTRVRFTARGSPMTRQAESCALCGRDLWDVGQYVQAADLNICDDCVRGARAAFERNPGERAVTMPPRGFGNPPPSMEDLTAIQEAFGLAFSGGVESLENGERLVKLSEELAQRLPGIRATFVVERVRLSNPDEAQVGFTVIVHPPMNMRLPMDGRAVRIDGRWKVARETFLAVMARGGVTFDDATGESS